MSSAVAAVKVTGLASSSTVSPMTTTVRDRQPRRPSLEDFRCPGELAQRRVIEARSRHGLPKPASAEHSLDRDHRSYPDLFALRRRSDHGVPVAQQAARVARRPSRRARAKLLRPALEPGSLASPRLRQSAQSPGCAVSRYDVECGLHAPPNGRRPCRRPCDTQRIRAHSYRARRATSGCLDTSMSPRPSHGLTPSCRTVATHPLLWPRDVREGTPIYRPPGSLWAAQGPGVRFALTSPVSRCRPASQGVTLCSPLSHPATWSFFVHITFRRILSRR